MTDLISTDFSAYLFDTAKAQAMAQFSQTPTGAAMPTLTPKNDNSRSQK
jgi:hypothetical protein